MGEFICEAGFFFLSKIFTIRLRFIDKKEKHIFLAIGS